MRGRLLIAGMMVMAIAFAGTPVHAGTPRRAAATSGAVDFLTSSEASAAPLPANANPSDPSPYAGDVSCPVAGTCMTAIDYLDPESHWASAVETTVAGTSTVTRLPAPGATQIQSLSCPTVTDCVAIGDYSPGGDTSVSAQIIDERYDGTGWSYSLVAPQPGTDPEVEPQFRNLDCPTVTFCAALGDDSDGEFAATWTATGGEWSYFNSLPYQAQFGDLTCTSESFCVAVGSAFDQSRWASDGEVATWDGSAWKITTAPLPDGVVQPGTTFGAGLTSVACVATTCRISGSYGQRYVSPAHATPYAVTLRDGTLSAVTLPVPSSLASIDVLAEEMSCPTATWCGAVLTPSADGALAVVDIFSGGSWSVHEVPPPTADDSADLQFHPGHGTLRCVAPGVCVIFGVIRGGDLGSGAFEDWLANGSWTPAFTALPSDAAGTGNPQSGYIANNCSVGLFCQAAFEYQNLHNYYGIAILTTPDYTVPAPTVSVAALHHRQLSAYVGPVSGKAGHWRVLGSAGAAASVVRSAPDASGKTRPLYLKATRDHRLRYRTAKSRWRTAKSTKPCNRAPVAASSGVTVSLACIAAGHHLVVGTAQMHGVTLSTVRWTKVGRRWVRPAVAIAGAGSDRNVFVLGRSHRLLVYRPKLGVGTVGHGCWSDVSAALTPSRNVAYVACRRRSGAVVVWRTRGDGWTPAQSFPAPRVRRISLAATTAGPIVVGVMRRGRLLVHDRHGWNRIKGKIVGTVAALGLD